MTYQYMTATPSGRVGYNLPVQAITAAGVINPVAGRCEITGPATSTYAVTLAAPTAAMIPNSLLTIVMVATTGTNSVTLALTNVVGGTAATTATFTVAGHSLVLCSMNNKWMVLGQAGVALT